MNLIAKNKLTEYIELFPEAKNNILLWVIEFTLRPGPDLENGHVGGVGKGVAQLGASSFRLKFSFNVWVEAAYITWFGTHEELVIQNKAEMEKLADNPEYIVKKIVFTPPPLSEMRKLSKFKSVPVLEKIGAVFVPIAESDNLCTKSEYEYALNRAFEIFDASPAMHDFAELELLISSIKKYEVKRIILPAIDPVDLATVRMKEMGFTPQNLAQYIGGEEEMDLFLTGRKALSTSKLKKLFHHLGIRHLNISELLN